MGLADKKCVPCEGGTPTVPENEARAKLKEIPGWEIVDGGKWLQRKMKFKNFVTALAYVNKIGEIAEAEGHHPDLGLGWGYVNIRLQTHAIGGLSENDFILAAKFNAIPT
jgi:4a-hydroxytetrahydrobiopterin dehydratase